MRLKQSPVKSLTLFISFLMFFSSTLFAQESMDTSRWTSPDILRDGASFRQLAKPSAGQAQTLAVPSSPNPDIPQSLLCQDLRVVFVLDESGSITGSEITSVETGALALANALLNSGASLELVEFNTTASIVNLGVTEVNSLYITRLNSYLGAGYSGQNYNPVSVGSCTGWTNWQDAMLKVATLNADLVIFFTDGNPTAYNVASGGNCSSNLVSAGQSTSLSLDAAVTQANVLKAQGKHMFVVGVGNTAEINLDNIKAISGNDAFGGGNDILTADYTQPPFEALATNLTAAVNSICGTEILVDKTASNSGVCSGQTVIFTNSVTNTGGDFNFTALSVVAKDVYPNGYSSLQFVPSAPSGASISGNTVTYNIGDMAAGQTVTYQVRATVLAPVPPKNYNNVISATAFNANEARDSVSVLSGYATAEIDTASCVPIVVNGTSYSTDGTYTQTLVSAAGCDSILTIIFTLTPPTTSSETVTVCDTYTWPVNGTTYIESGTYTSSATSAEGCVHTSTLILIVNNSTSVSTPVTACDSYTWAVNGATYTESGSYTVNSTNAAGCPHTETLVLTINNSTSNSTAVTACDSYTWAVNGATYTESGSYTVNSTNAAGCPHAETLVLTIDISTSNTTEASACDSYSWAESGVTYYQSGTYTVNSTNAAGCTHTETLILTINESTTNVTTASACESYVWSVNGNTYTESGLYTSVSINAAGCTYTEALSLTINLSTFNTVTETVCDSYTWAADGVTYTESGTYTSTSTNAEGCTNTETLILTVNKSTTNTTEVAACDSYIWSVNGTTYTESGTYTSTSTNAEGCTHTETLVLIINNSTSNTTTLGTCNNYTWPVNGMTYTESGTYTVNSTNAAGCPHTETLVLTISNSSSTTTPVTACDSYTWGINGNTYTESGTYTVTSSNSGNCPHSEILVLTINKSTSNSTPITVCDSYTWPVNGTTYTESGTFTVSSTNAAGCPHTETLVLTVNKSSSNTTPVKACNSYTWPVNGVTYTQGGTYSVSSTNAAGCPHTETIVLSISTSTSNTTTASACGSYRWAVNNVTYTTGGTYTVTTPNAAGCIHSEILVLTISGNTSSITSITACNSYKWPVNGVTYTASGTYTSSTTNSAGCVNTQTLILKINKGTYKTTTISACNSYVWAVNGTTYTQSGTYFVYSTNAAGCACTEKLVLTITKTPVIGTINCPATVCRNQTGVVYSVAPVSGATSYTWLLPAGITGTSTTNSITVAIGTSFTTGVIKVRANNTCGSSAYAQTVVTSPTAVPAACGSITGIRLYCAAGNYVYSIAAVANAASYVWTVTGSGLSIQSGQGGTSITVTTTSAFVAGTIAVKAVNCLGSSSPGTISVTASKTLAKPGAISGPATGLCKMINVAYSVAAVPGATSYTWTVPTGATIVSGAGTNSIRVTFAGGLTGACSISVKANNACGSSATSSLNLLMVPGTPVANGGSLSVLRTQSAVIYSVAALSGATSYSWTITGGARFVGSTTGNSVTVNFNTATRTTAVISVKATNACGSSVVSSATIAVNLGNTAARGINNGNDLVDELTKAASNYVVYPNPNRGQFNISFNTQQMDRVALLVSDLTGRIIYNNTNTYQEGAQISKVNISKFAKGIYFVRIVKNNEQEKVIKIVVE